MTDAYLNGSSFEIIPGSVPARGGPKPTMVHFDEVELISDDIWGEISPAYEGYKAWWTYYLGWLEPGEYILNRHTEWLVRLSLIKERLNAMGEMFDEMFR